MDRMSIYGHMMTLIAVMKFISMTQKTMQMAAVLRLRKCHMRGGKLRMKTNGARTARIIP